jgi:hypothetical protein
LLFSLVMDIYLFNSDAETFQIALQVLFLMMDNNPASLSTNGYMQPKQNTKST